MPPSADDYRYMARALQLAERGLFTTDPNPRVGCVLVKAGRIVGEGWHERAGGPHAEVVALEAAGEEAKGATCYVTLEPCSHHGRTPPCANALIEAGIARAVIAMEDPNPQVAGSGIALLEEADIPVELGVLREEAEALNPGFIQRHRLGRPFVRCKLAMSLDGRTAMASGESQWITGEAARLDGQRLRARSSAVMTGSGTVLADDPSLTVRAFDIGRQPLRVVIDPHLSIPIEARLLKAPGQVLIVTACQDEETAKAFEKRGAEVLYLPGPEGRVDLHALMKVLAEREINEVHLETGATLSGAMLKAGLIDEMVFYMAPLLLGDSARGLFHLPLDTLEEGIPLSILDIRAVGKDWRITARPA